MLDCINVCGKIYTIEYVKSPSEVDIYKRKSLWGQVGYWTRSIRIYNKDVTKEDIFEILLHEIGHIIFDELHLKNVDEDTHDILFMALSDTLIRNKLIEFTNKGGS